jgi:hypothetical protein
MGAGAPRACAPARRRDRGSKGKGGRDGGESPGLHKRISGGEESSGFALRAEGRGDRPGRSRIFEGLHPCPREGGALSPSTKKKRISESASEAIRRPRDRLKGQPQERSIAPPLGGTRDRPPPASGSRATSRLVGINFAFVISSHCCACRYSACA